MAVGSGWSKWRIDRHHRHDRHHMSQATARGPAAEASLVTIRVTVSARRRPSTRDRHPQVLAAAERVTVVTIVMVLPALLLLRRAQDLAAVRKRRWSLLGPNPSARTRRG